MAESRAGLGLAQQPGMSWAARAVVAADAALASPAEAPDAIELAIRAAVTDYRRAFVRRMIQAGMPRLVVWSVMRDLPVDRPLPRELVAPIYPGVD